MGGIQTRQSTNSAGIRVVTINSPQIDCPNTIAIQKTPANPTDAVPKSYVDGLLSSGQGGVTQAQLANYLPLLGGTISGQITLASTPNALTSLVNKGYVDGFTGLNIIPSASSAAIGNVLQVVSGNTLGWSSPGSGFLSIGGGTLTGALFLPSANPSAYYQAVHKQYVDQQILSAQLSGGGSNVNLSNYLTLSGGTMTGNLLMGPSTTLTLAGPPSATNHAATMGYVTTAMNTVLPSLVGVTSGHVLQVGNNSSLLWGSVTASGSLLLTGGTLTGNLTMGGSSTLTLAANPVSGVAGAMQAATRQYVDNYALPIVGGTLTGNLTMGGSSTLTLAANPVSGVAGAMQAATRQYVDNYALPIVGGTLTGNLTMGGSSTLTLAANPVSGVAGAMQAATRQYVDNNALPIVGGTLTGNLTMGGSSTLTLAANPVSAMQAATRQYVDGLFIDPWSGWTVFTPTFVSVNGSTIPAVGTGLTMNYSRYKVINHNLFIKWDYCNGPGSSVTSGSPRYNLALPGGYTPNSSFMIAPAVPSNLVMGISSPCIGELKFSFDGSNTQNATIMMYMSGNNIIGYGGVPGNIDYWGSQAAFGNGNNYYFNLNVCIPIN